MQTHITFFFQIVTAVSIIQKLPEIARSMTTSPEVLAFYEHLTSKNYMQGNLFVVSIHLVLLKHQFCWKKQSVSFCSQSQTTRELM